MGLLLFKDIIGNSNNTTLLKRAIARRKAPRFIIIHGTMGTGKTSTALAAAMGITCESQQNGEPCLECHVCKQNVSALSQGSSSQTIVNKNMARVKKDTQMEDLIRNIFQLLQGTAGENVYILGELHALRPELQESILEELDSIPGNVTVIATTTSLRKLIPPLVSRSVHYRYGRLSEAESRLLFDKTVKDLGIKAPSNEVRSLLIRDCRGIARDLVKMIHFVVDSSPSISELRKHLGYVDDAVFLNLFGALSDTLQSYMRILTHCLEETQLEDFVAQSKQFLEKVLFSLEGVKSEELSSKDRTKVQQILTKEQWYKVSFFFERLNPNNLDEDGFRLSMIKLKQGVSNRKESDIFVQNEKTAVKEKAESQENAFEEKTYQESRSGEMLRPLTLKKSSEFSSEPGGN